MLYPLYVVLCMLNQLFVLLLHTSILSSNVQSYEKSDTIVLLIVAVTISSS